MLLLRKINDAATEELALFKDMSVILTSELNWLVILSILLITLSTKVGIL